MFTKFLAAGLLGSALLVSPALAEDTGAMNKVGASTTAEAYHGDWRTSKVVGLSVYNSKDENIGAINDLLMDKSGNIKAVVIGVGGFLGMGEHLVAIPFEKIKFVDQPVTTASTATTSGATWSKTCLQLSKMRSVGRDPNQATIDSVRVEPGWSGTPRVAATAAGALWHTRLAIRSSRTGSKGGPASVPWIPRRTRQTSPDWQDDPASTEY